MALKSYGSVAAGGEVQEVQIVVKRRVIRRSIKRNGGLYPITKVPVINLYVITKVPVISPGRNKTKND